MKRVALLLLWTVVILARQATPAVGQETFADSYAADINSLLDKRFSGSNAAMVIGLIDEHGSRVFSVGELDNGGQGAVDGDTIFELGSVTKVFTSLLLLDAVRRGEVKLDDPVAMYLPAGVKVPSYEGKQITLLNLAIQDSGLPWHPRDFTKSDRNPTLPEIRDAANAFTAEDLYESLARTELPASPGTKFQYSNVGMALLGHALELKTGSKYESLVIDRVCRPLAMDSTRIALTSDQKTRLARGHWADGSPSENLNFQVMQPAGSLLSTTKDLLKFVGANLGLGDSPLIPMLKKTQEIRYTNQTRFGKTAMPWFDEACRCLQMVQEGNAPGLQKRLWALSEPRMTNVPVTGAIGDGRAA